MKKKSIIICIVLVIISVAIFIIKIHNISFIENVKQAIINRSEEKTNEAFVTTIDITNLEIKDGIEHEHVLISKYDETNHWNECRVCGKKLNLSKHSFSTTWALGYESCNSNNYATSVCSCGYTEYSSRPHVWNGSAYVSWTGYVHARKCSVCTEGIVGSYYLGSYGNGQIYSAKFNGSYISPVAPHAERCHLANGSIITCSNPGVCVVCGSNVANQHDFQSNPDSGVISCHVCGRQFGTFTYTITRDSNTPATYTVIENINLISGVTYDGTEGACDLGGYLQTNTASLISGSIGSNNFSLKYTLKFNSIAKGTKTTRLRKWIKINNIRCLFDIGYYTFYPDLIKPTISSVNMEGGTQLDKWSRSKPIVISGTENWTDTVTVKVLDNDENVIYTGSGNVVNGKYSISCTPDVECDIYGKNFKVIVIDACDNSAEKIFKIAKVDSFPPEPTSGVSITGEWTKSRNFKFTATDNGIGNVSIAFNDIKDLDLAIFDGKEYYREYNFVGDVYRAKELAVLYKDELGNSCMQKVTIDKIDNTSPTILYAGINNNILEIRANDVKEGLGEGSGVSKYRYITSKEKLDSPLVTASAIEVNKEDKVIISNIYDVRYIYIVAEDAVRKCK